MTMYRRKKTPPLARIRSAHATRTSAGSRSKYSATPPATPAKTRSVLDR
jgi:hypothetical protein